MIKDFALAALLAATVAWGMSPAMATEPVAFQPASESQRFAQDRLFEMARFLGEKQRFSTSLRISYDVLQEDGQKIEFVELRDVAVERPRRMRIVETSSVGSKGLTLFDGDQITVSSGAPGLHTQVAQPGDIDDSVIYFVRDLKMRLPLAPVLMLRLTEALQKRLTSVEYIERSVINGSPAHHIAGRTANVDFQIWIAGDRKPLPQRIVMTYKNEVGQPQFRADFSNWNLAPRYDKATFKFTPSAGLQ